MLKNYFVIAWRNLRKDKLYAFLNIIGLAVATAAFLLIVNFVRFEQSYENFHHNAPDIFRVTTQLYKGSELVFHDCETYPPMGPLLKKDMPEVKDFVRVQDMAERREVRAGDKYFQLNKIYAADPSMFTIFDYEFIEGDPQTALRRPMEAVLTETTAKQLFGPGPALGKTYLNQQYLYTVTGVIKDVPPNTHLKFDLLMSFSSLEKMGWRITDNWNGNNNYLYLLMAPGTDVAAFNQKLRKVSAERLENEVAVAEPAKDIHLYSHKGYEPEINGDAKTVQFLTITALLVLLVGAVNYVNMTTARSAERIKEIAMRKVLGSSRGLLIGQLLAETLLVNLFAMGLSLLIVWLSLPAYFALIGRPVQNDFFITSSFWLICMGLFLLNCLLSGLYPAMVLSAVKPVSITKRYHTSRGGNLFRKVLVTGQFAAALLVLSASFVVYRQLAFLRGQDMGLDAKNLLVVDGPLSNGSDSARVQTGIVLKNELKNLPGVKTVTLCEGLPGVDMDVLNTTVGVTRLGSEEGKGYSFTYFGIDEDFVPAMKMRLAAGENFRDGSARRREVLINEEAARLLGFKSPAEAIGRKINGRSFGVPEAAIAGVIKNYNQQSLKNAVPPIIHHYIDEPNFFGVKLATGDVSATLAQVKKVWEKQYPGYAFNYHFMNDMFDEQYKADQQFEKIARVFSIFILLITCMGVLGLTAYNIARRTREIGIRKVLGASVTGIVTLLSKDFIRLVFISAIIASPLAWLAMHRWLQDFAYRIELKWWMFALPGLAALSVALFTIGFQSVKAALTNPVKSLRSE
ncbi:ABC transporter permease [Chitinophaga sp. GCM10012297]|uniref:ABC transporter permease n=1 Tax=Chitinophaga chungangae TaxID=2821488 RepID=A0ABS3YBR8_9BACT|nr:ABC transporter permease [Chitinophaga chungangae]MBO9151778.1 ABC transporter permease [Chitinophaga chungangae]